VLLKKEKENKMEDTKLLLKVYDDDDKVIKEVKADMVRIKWGTINKIFELSNIDNLGTMEEMLKVVSGAWNAFKDVLGKVFKGMTDEDWDGVYIEDLIPLVYKILIVSMTKIKKATEQEKN
jgi:hypothetical protein